MPSLFRIFVGASYVMMIVLQIIGSKGHVWPIKFTNAQVSNMYPTVLTPQGFTFAVRRHVLFLSSCDYTHSN